MSGPPSRMVPLAALEIISGSLAGSYLLTDIDRRSTP